VNNDENATKGVSAQSYEAKLTCRVGVLDRDRQRITQRLLSVSKADAMLL